MVPEDIPLCHDACILSGYFTLPIKQDISYSKIELIQLSNSYCALLLATCSQMWGVMFLLGTFRVNT